MSLAKKEIVETAYNLSLEYRKMIKLGDSGVYIDKKWKDCFYQFYKWSVNSGYRAGMVLDLKVSDLGYRPMNCRFVENVKASNGKRRKRLDSVNISYKGKTRTATEWANLMNIPRTTIYSRVKMGWSDEQIIEGKPRKGEENGND